MKYLALLFPEASIERTMIGHMTHGIHQLKKYYSWREAEVFSGIECRGKSVLWIRREPPPQQLPTMIIVNKFHKLMAKNQSSVVEGKGSLMF